MRFINSTKDRVIFAGEFQCYLEFWVAKHVVYWVRTSWRRSPTAQCKLELVLSTLLAGTVGTA